MTDEYWKKRAEQLRHYEPAEISGDSVERLLQQFQQPIPQAPSRPNIPPGEREIDLTSALMARAMANQGMPSQIVGGQMPPNDLQASGGNVVSLRPGFQVFKELQGTNSHISLAVLSGDTSELSGKQMVMQGIKEAYVLTSQMEAVDLSNLDSSKITKLVSIKIPWIGNVLVSENAIIKPNNQRRQQILSD
jgi:hypothetical protein